jgi:hypothetical protein
MEVVEAGLTVILLLLESVDNLDDGGTVLARLCAAGCSE